MSKVTNLALHRSKMASICALIVFLGIASCGGGDGGAATGVGTTSAPATDTTPTSTPTSNASSSPGVNLTASIFSVPTTYSNSYCSNGGVFPSQWEWNAATKQVGAVAATGGTPLVKHLRNGVVIATYTQLSGGRSNPNNLNGSDNSVGPFRRLPYTQWQDGDVFEVYPAIYEGEEQQIYIGPNVENDAAFNAGVFATPKNITIRGITVGGVKPVIRTPSTGASNANFNQGVIYLGQSENITIENIDVQYVQSSGFVGKAGIYVNGTKNLTLRNVRVSGFRRTNQNGIFATSLNSGNLLLESVELYDNGGNNGPEHNAYINASSVDNNFTFKVVGSWSHASWYGHLLKSRAQVNIIEGSYLSGTRAAPADQTETYLLDVPEGGTLIVRNSVFVKNYSGPNSNAASITFGVERNSTNYDLTRPWNLIVEHNTFVAFAREYDNSGVAARWLFPFFFKNDTPGPRTVQHNVFVGYCLTGVADKDYRGTDSVNLNFNQIDEGFRPRTALANGNPSITGYPQYNHIGKPVLRTSIQAGARD